MNNLAVLLCEHRKYSEAEPMLEQAYVGYKGTLGPAHATTVSLARNYGQILFANGKRDEALELLSGALAAAVEAHGQGHAHCKALAAGCVQLLTAYGGRDGEVATLRADYELCPS